MQSIIECTIIIRLIIRTYGTHFIIYTVIECTIITIFIRTILYIFGLFIIYTVVECTIITIFIRTILYIFELFIISRIYTVVECTMIMRLFIGIIMYIL